MVGYRAIAQSLPPYKDLMINIEDGCHLAYSLPELREIIMITPVWRMRNVMRSTKFPHSDAGYKRQGQTLTRALPLWPVLSSAAPLRWRPHANSLIEGQML